MTHDEVSQAIQRGDLADVQKWLEQSPDELNRPLANGQSAIHLSVQAGQLEILGLLLRSEALVNIASHDELEATPLHLAASGEDDHPALEMMEVLLANGAELNCRDCNGRTALHLAALHAQTARVQSLIEAGADPFLKDLRGTRPVDLAANEEIRRVLKIKT